MSEIWNEFELKKPPLIIINASNGKFVRKLYSSINKYFQQHVDQGHEFAKTAALLSRLMARRKNSFRRMIGFRAICKLNAALCRLLRVDLQRDLESFRSALPDTRFNDGDDGSVELPTRNYFDYVLVRLVSVQRLHQRIRECCLEAADYFAKMLRNSFFLEINTLLLAVFAKLYSLSGLLGNKCVELYGKLRPQRENFPQAGSFNFLPADADLPAQLEEFSCEELPGSELESNTSASLQLNASLPNTAMKSIAPVLTKQQQRMDVGMAVERTSNVTTFNVQQLASVQDVKKFIAAENAARKKSLQQSVTARILNHEWLGAQKLFEKKLQAKEHKRALSIFCNFLKNKI